MRQIFVFGSNTQGRHGKGAALEARKNWGAIYGQPSGLQGNSYGIITKELRAWLAPTSLAEIVDQSREFLAFSKAHPELEFLLSPIGCGLAGFTPAQIAPLFRHHPDNVRINTVFLRALDILDGKEWIHRASSFKPKDMGF